MTNPDALDALAQTVLKRRAGDTSTDVPNLSLEDGYAVQDAVHKIQESTRNWHGIGYKVGATNGPARKGLGLEQPFYGRLYKELSFPSPARHTLNEALSSTIEVEVAVRISRDLKAENGPWDAASIRAACSAMLPAIEITGSTMKFSGPPCAPNIIADFAGHAFWVFGKAIEDFSAIDPAKISATLSVDGKAVETGMGSAVDGAAFGSAAFLANALNARGLYLKAGDLITTGTIIKPVPCQPGSTIRADYGTFGSVEIQF